MIDFPGNTRVGRRLPKEAFYQHLPLTPALKARFVTDVDRIVVENSLTKGNLNLAKDAEIKEIMLLTIMLKKHDFDSRIVEAIARQNPHKLIFLLCYEDQRQLAVYHSRLYRTEWMPEDKVYLSLSGNNMNDIWDNLVQQVAVHSETVLGQKDKAIDDKLKMQDEIDRLNKLIRKTEAAAWKEQQPKKRFELYTRMQGYKRQLEEIIHG